MKDAGIPSGPILEITHYLECFKQLEENGHAPSASSPATPSPTTPPQPSYYQQQVMHVAGKRARHGSSYYSAYGADHEGGCYAAGGVVSSAKPASPLATFQLLPPPPLANLKQQPQPPTLLRQQSVPILPQMHQQAATTAHVVLQPSLPSAPELQPAYYQVTAELTGATYQQQTALQCPQPVATTTCHQPPLPPLPPLPSQGQGQGSQLATTYQQQPPLRGIQPLPQGSRPLAQGFPLPHGPQPTTTYQQTAPVALPATQQHPHLPQQVSERREVLEAAGSVASVGSPATGQRGIKQLPLSISAPATPQVPAPRGTSQDKHSPQLVEQQASVSSSNQPQRRFARITCVSCGGSDHPTPQCPDRNNFFTHM